MINDHICIAVCQSIRLSGIGGIGIDNCIGQILGNCIATVLKETYINCSTNAGAN